MKWWVFKGKRSAFSEWKVKIVIFWYQRNCPFELFLQNKQKTKHSVLKFLNVYGGILVENTNMFCQTHAFCSMTMHLVTCHTSLSVKCFLVYISTVLAWFCHMRLCGTKILLKWSNFELLEHIQSNKSSWLTQTRLMLSVSIMLWTTSLVHMAPPTEPTLRVVRVMPSFLVVAIRSTYKDGVAVMLVHLQR